MGYFSDRDPGELQGGVDHLDDDLRLDSESIIFEMTPDGWSAKKLTRMGWFTATALTIDRVRVVLAAQIRTALAQE